MIDHLSLGVADLDRAANLYDAALGALGYVRLAHSARSVCYGPPGFSGEAPFAHRRAAGGGNVRDTNARAAMREGALRGWGSTPASALDHETSGRTRTR